MHSIGKFSSRLMTFFLFNLVLFVLSVHAQGQNLLTNPGFEQPFATLDGNPPRQVAQGWQPWHIGGGQSSSENIQPEYYPASDVTNGLGVPRIRSGSDAQQYHSFFSTHDGGLLQRVTTGLKAGDALRFSAYIYVWSSTFDNPDDSEEDGGVVVQVGIDPKGGTNGESGDIVWSAPSIQYDAYNEYSVTTTAAGNAVTVFVRSTVTTPVQNNNIYADDATLVVSGSTSNPTLTSRPTNTSVPPTATATQRSSPTATVGVASNTPSGNTGSPTAAPASPTATTTVAPSTTAVPSNTPTTVAPTAPSSVTNTSVPASPAPTTAPIASATSAPISSEFPGRIIHTVQSGDKVVNLAALYGSSVDAIIAANGLNPSAFIRVGQPLIIPVRLAAPATSTPTATSPAQVPPPTSSAPGTGSTTTYVVQTGDTLGRIAVRFNTSVAALSQLNGIANPNVIRPGQRLVIPVAGSPPVVTQSPVTTPAATVTPVPAARTYVVQPGDTLFRIAVRFRVSMSQIAQANNISDFNRVYVGQVLVIP